MKTADLRIQLAVMNGLRHLGATPGRPKSLEVLEDRWPAYGLRREDLPAGVASLAARNLVEIRRAEGTGGDRIFVAMTGHGIQWLEAQPALFEYQLLVPRQAQRRMERASRRSPLPVRRRGDAVHA